jgi:adenine-specific DNA methylase
VIGYDIDPVASFITRFELSAANWAETAPQDALAVCFAISQQIAPFHKTRIDDGPDLDVLHHFWVEIVPCQNCSYEIEAHPHFQLAYDSNKDLQWVFCRQCHKIYELSLNRQVVYCECGKRTRISKGTIYRGKLTCPVCQSSQKLSAIEGRSETRPSWRLFAQEYLERSPKGLERKFKGVTDDDQELYDSAAEGLRNLELQHGVFAPQRPIPSQGRGDQRPLIHGIKSYRDFFNDRQLLHLSLLGRVIVGIENLREKEYMALAFSEHLTTNCMYTGYAFGYRRTSPMFSIHSYRHITRPVELNPWIVDAGRGTFPRTIEKIRRATEFVSAPSDLDPEGGRRPSTQAIGVNAAGVARNAAAVIYGEARAAICTQSATDLSGIPAGSVDLVLTDFPYFDNLSYSELSDFYLSWQQKLGVAEPPYDEHSKPAPLEENLAVSKKTADAVERYRRDLASILSECFRVLRKDGLCIFTYHHKSYQAWDALGEALARSGLNCTSVIPLRGEGQGGMHTEEGSLKWDAVLVCRPSDVQAPMDKVAGSVMISPKAVATANKTAHQFAQRLSKNKRIGFKAQDHLNFLRALIVSKALLRANKRGMLSLENALKSATIKEQPRSAKKR